ncbi:universal stress protein [Reichenbachiella sp.]|uniref:universal stress protein n=1 Tax=Reichenbachiella sp. TaxID=2184521 RepID=UPI003BB0C972
MISVRNVLVPIDFSKASKAVVKYAIDAEAHKNDHLVLLHAYRLIADDFSSQRDSPVELRKSIESQLLQNYNTFNENLDLRKKPNHLEFKMEVGFTVNCIRSLCRQNKFDLILYALKEGKKNEQLADLIKLGCSPVQLISEKYNAETTKSLIGKGISRADFFDSWEDYIHQIEQNPKLSYTVAPD